MATTFSEDRAIYLQMADRLCDMIIDGTYSENNRIPSVREYSVSLGVNTNTAVKTYEYLSRLEIIYNRRGMGYYVAQGAKDKIVSSRRAEFMEKTLPAMFKEMSLLGISIESVVEQYNQNLAV